MGFSEKPQVDGGFESDNSRKWLIAGIALRAPLKPVYTTVPVEKTLPNDGDTDQESTTPTAEEARIPTPLKCPPAPRKRRPTTKCGYNGGVREFFNPPDLETVFIRNVERAN